ncbi:hypothetical protein [Vreelandella neptunia]|uniref:hypothetical protein n=1 Tax=Vreelandella neptunia TaxID=115551 RepID=UPI00315AD078
MTSETAFLEPKLVEQANNILNKTPGWEDKQAHIEWMPGGGAHKNLRVTAGDQQCMIKVWNTTWEGLGVIPPSGVVMENTRLAGEIGSGASLLHISLDPLAIVIEFIPSTLLDTTHREGTRLLATAARKLHDSQVVFA